MSASKDIRKDVFVCLVSGEVDLPSCPLKYQVRMYRPEKVQNLLLFFDIH